MYREGVNNGNLLNQCRETLNTFKLRETQLKNEIAKLKEEHINDTQLYEKYVQL